MNLSTLSQQNARALARPKTPKGDLMTAINEFPYRGFIQVEVFGVEPFVMFSNYDDIVAQHYLFRGPDSFESLSLQLWAQLAAISNVALDVGAFTGIYGLVATHANPNLKVMAFEPSLNTFARLVTNVLANDMGGRLGTIKAALGEADGTLTLKHPAGIHCLGSEETLVDGRHASVWFEEEARVMTGDTMAGHQRARPKDFIVDIDLAKTDLIKIDVEGFEIRVLRGMKKLLASNKPALIIECLGVGQFDEVNAVLAPLGYHSRFVDDEGHLLHQDRARFSRHPRNVLFHADAHVIAGFEAATAQST